MTAFARQASIKPQRAERTPAAIDPFPMMDVEAEFDRFAASMRAINSPTSAEIGPRRVTGENRSNSRRSISASEIYEYALALLDAEGEQALTARRLAAGMNISTRTLYKRIGNHDNLIAKVVQLHCASLRLRFREVIPGSRPRGVGAAVSTRRCVHIPMSLNC